MLYEKPECKNGTPKFTFRELIQLKLQDLLYGVNLTETTADLTAEISDVTCYSEAVKPGGMFICICGTRSDGHDFIDRAVYNRASVIVVQDGCLSNAAREFLHDAESVSYVSVKNTREAEAHIYNNKFGNPVRRLRLIAVTGTNGKTTTSYMLHSILTEAGYKTSLIGTTTGTLTTPDPDVLYCKLRDMADEGTVYAVLEASSHALFFDKLAPCIFDAGIFTNLTPEHLDFHGTMENYYAAKSKLFEQCRIGIFNYDSEYGQKMYLSAPCDKYYYSAGNDTADFTAKAEVNRGTDGIGYCLLAKNLMFRIFSPIPGKFTVYNTLAAASASLVLGIDPHVIRTAIGRMNGVPGRIQRVPTKRDDIAVFIDYAHTPDALENVLRAVRNFMKTGQHLTVLFGCGGDRDRSKRPVMGSIASRLADFVIITSDNSRSEPPLQIIGEIIKGIDRERPHIVIESRREAIIYAVKNAQPGEVLLLCGKGHEDYEINAQGRFPFNEADIVTEASI